MRFVIVVGDMVLNSFIEFKTIIRRIQIDVIVFDRFPEPFDPDIIQGSAFSIHGDEYFILF